MRRRGRGPLRIDAAVEDVDFAGIDDEVTSTLSGIDDGMAASERAEENLTLVRAEGRFVDDPGGLSAARRLRG